MRIVLSAMLAVCIAFAAVLSLGSYLRQRVPSLSDNAFGTIAGLAIVILVVAITWLLNPSLFSLPLLARRGTHPAVTEHQRRIAELAADPVKRKYAALVERGEWWTDDQILYNETPSMVATCAHLQAIEYAMRLAGLKVRMNPLLPSVPASVTVDCRINEPEFKRRYVPAESVHYREYFQPERSQWDNPTADILCSECRSRIQVVHPSEAGEGTPWFP